MSKPFSIGLKGGERVYINGAVLRPDRKVVIEFLNDVDFLLEQHVMRPDETSTPLRQLYFIAQTMLIDPANRAQISAVFDTAHGALMRSFSSRDVLTGLAPLGDLARSGRTFDVLKALRGLFPLEDAILAKRDAEKQAAATGDMSWT